jgi:hypothetical protein
LPRKGEHRIEEPFMRMLCLAGAVVAGTLTSGAATPAAAQTVAGQLRCSIAGGFGLVVAAQRSATCVYRRVDGSVEFYLGSTGRIGVDFGLTNAVTATYNVSAPDSAPPGALQGIFAGPGAGFTLGAGIGANALVGGTGAILTPIDNTYVTGLDISAGLGTLDLRYVGRETPHHRRR